MIAVLIPGVRILSEPNVRDHRMVRARRVKKQRLDVTIVLRAHISKPPAPPLLVTIVRVHKGRGSRDYDDDNLIAGAKAIRDAIAAWLRIDDGDPRVQYQYAQEKGDDVGVRILMEAA
jgi:hypothetical protein